MPGWVNIDGSWNALLAKYPVARRLLARLRIVPATAAEVPFGPHIVIRDLRKRLPYPDNSVEAIYASHLIEHLYVADAKALIAECHRVIKPGGVLRLVVPDLNAIVREYVGEVTLTRYADMHDGMTPADIMMRRLHLRSTRPMQGPLPFRIYRTVTDFDIHKWMYDATSLAALVRELGFVDVSERALHESRIADITSIEDPARVLNGEGICIEGVKPTVS